MLTKNAWPSSFWPFTRGSFARWQKDTITAAERSEVVRLQAIIPEVRPLIQRPIALATELDKRAKTGVAFPCRKWRH